MIDRVNCVNIKGSPTSSTPPIHQEFLWIRGLVSWLVFKGLYLDDIIYDGLSCMCYFKFL